MASPPRRDLTGKVLTCPDQSRVTFLELLGAGATGEVYKCERIASPEASEASGTPLILAAKVIDVRKLRFVADFDRERDKLKREIAILASLSHTGVVNLYGVIDSSDWLVLLMDYVEGGELFNYVLNAGALTEDQARFVFHQVAHTVCFLHSEGIIHRDVKLENILVCEQPKPNFFVVKVADFGLSKLITGGFTKARSYVGTPQYWAPEVVTAAQTGSTYSFEADIWSLGCLLYVMIGGTYPFASEQSILSGSFHFRYPRFDNASDMCLDLIRGMLKVNPKERLSIMDVLNHPWLNKAWVALDVPPLPEHRKVDRPAISMNVGPTIVGTKEAANLVSITSQPKPLLTPEDTAPTAIGFSPVDPSLVASSIVPAPAKIPAIPMKPEQPFSTTIVGLFKTEMLLELLSRVFYRFHQAYLVFRCHEKLRREFERLLSELRDLTLETQKVFKRFGVTCGSVLELIQDVASVVQEGSPELAAPMFDNLREWIIETKEDGLLMRNKFKHFTKEAADLVVFSRDLDTPWTTTDGRVTWCALPATKPVPRPFMLRDSHSQERRHSEITSRYSRERESIFEEVECVKEQTVPHDVAKRLFDFVFVSPEVVPNVVRVETCVGKDEEILLTQQPIDADGTTVSRPVVSRSTDMTEDAGSSPEIVQSQKGSLLEPKIEETLSGSFTAEAATPPTEEKARLLVEEEPGSSPGGMEEPSSSSAAGGVSEAEKDQVIASVDHQQAAWEQKTRVLIQGVDELQRISDILEQCTAFWDNLDVTLGLLRKFRDQTIILLQFGKDQQRFLTRLKKYESFWTELSLQCSQFVEKSDTQSQHMRQFVEAFNESMVRANQLAAVMQNRMRGATQS